MSFPRIALVTDNEAAFSGEANAGGGSGLWAAGGSDGGGEAAVHVFWPSQGAVEAGACLLYTSPSPRD